LWQVACGVSQRHFEPGILDPPRQRSCFRSTASTASCSIFAAHAEIDYFAGAVEKELKNA